MILQLSITDYPSHILWRQHTIMYVTLNLAFTVRVCCTYLHILVKRLRKVEALSTFILMSPKVWSYHWYLKKYSHAEQLIRNIGLIWIETFYLIKVLEFLLNFTHKTPVPTVFWSTLSKNVTLYLRFSMQV